MVEYVEEAITKEVQLEGENLARAYKKSWKETACTSGNCTGCIAYCRRYEG